MPPLNSSSKHRLHLGCGLTTPAGWINIDGSWNARLAKHPELRWVASWLRLIPAEKADIPWASTIFIHDVRKPLPFPRDSAEAIYSSHLLEHLYFDEARRLIQECFRVLAMGGVLRIVVPDLGAIIREYLGEAPIGKRSQEFEAMQPADRVNRRLLLRTPVAPNGNFLYRIYAEWKNFHEHKWMYDAGSLKALFETAGFTEVAEMPMFVSRISGIEEIEQPSRVENGEGICLEGIKPRV